MSEEDRRNEDPADEGREQDRQREIDDLLKGGGGGRPAREGELEDLLGSPGARSSEARRLEPEASSHSSPAAKKTALPGARRESARAGTASGESSGAELSGKVKLPLNYGALVGVLIAFVAVFILVNALRNAESGTVGIGPVGIGEKVDPFAVPIADSELEGDANVDPDEACRVEGGDVLRICDFFDRPLLMSFWFTGGAAECIDQQDVFDQVAARFRTRIAAVSINVRDDRDRVRDLIDERGWKVPVGHDTDGAVSNMYRIGGCPTFLFVRAGGVLERAEIGRTTVEELSSQVRSFLDGQEMKEESPAKDVGA
jgi:hypothetical protein